MHSRSTPPPSPPAWTDVVAITFEPGQDQCLWVLHPGLPTGGTLTPIARTWLGVSNAARIQASPGQRAAGCNLRQRARAARGATTSRKPIWPPRTSIGTDGSRPLERSLGVLVSAPRTGSSCCLSFGLRQARQVAAGAKPYCSGAEFARSFHFGALRSLGGSCGRGITFDRAWTEAREQVETELACQQ